MKHTKLHRYYFLIVSLSFLLHIFSAPSRCCAPSAKSTLIQRLHFNKFILRKIKLILAWFSRKIHDSFLEKFRKSENVNNVNNTFQCVWRLANKCHLAVCFLLYILKVEICENYLHLYVLKYRSVAKWYSLLHFVITFLFRRACVQA